MKSLLAQLPPAPPERTGWPWREETPPSVYAGRSDWPRLSIVTPSYNQAGYLEETIRSILLQNYPNLQYLVIDGGSTDGSAAIVARYSAWLDHWESARDRGQSHAINKGLGRCDGRFFNWINSDDCLLPGALAAIGGADQNAVILSAAEVTGPALLATQPLGRTKIGPTLEDTLVNHFICQQGLFLRTDVVRELQGVREDFHYVMDLELFARVLLKCGLDSVREIPACVAFFRRHADAKTATATDKFLQEERRLFLGLGAALGLDPALLKYVSDAPLPPGPAADVSRLDAGRLAQALALKFWWDGPVEGTWRARDFPAFKREATAFFRAFPVVRDHRRSKLHFMSRLPEPLLQILARFRSAG